MTGVQTCALPIYGIYSKPLIPVEGCIRIDFGWIYVQIQRGDNELRELFLELDKVDKVTKADIRRVATQVFIPGNRTSAWIETEAPSPTAQKATTAKDGDAQ